MTQIDERAGLEIARWDNVVEVRFDRPDNHNSVTSDMVTELYVVLDEVRQSPEIDVVVLTGNGRAFCPGADLKRARDGAKADERSLPDVHVYQSARLLHEMPQVTIAAVNGACAGAGMAWASACDLRLASDGARFATSFLELGLASELGLVWHLQHSLGGTAARELCFLPRKLNAAELQVRGYLSAVFPDESFHTDAWQVIADLAARGGRALRTLKANFVDAERLSLGDYIEVETQRHQGFFSSADQAETLVRLAQQAERVSGGGQGVSK